MSKITFGCCLPGGSFMPEGVAEVPTAPDEQLISKSAAILSAGFDYTECAAAMLTKLSETQFDRVLEENRKNPLCLRACNSLMSGEFPIVGPEVDDGRIEAFLDLLLPRMNALGARYAVFGSGRARSVPQGWTREKTLKQLSKFMDLFARKADRFGISLAIEPLRRKETDIFNTVFEAATAARNSITRNLFIIADSFHMSEEGTCPEALSEVRDVLVHCHISEPVTRAFPGSANSADPLYNVKFAKALSSIGFEGTVTAECAFNDFKKDIVFAIQYLNQIFCSD